jgi:N-acetylglutamate synthase-like GNAT family acetyltransferase
MNSANSQTRRATLDDLVELRKLWQQTRLSITHLERHLTEFQIVETADGTLLGCVGLKLEGPHGKIHSEAYRNSDLVAELRPRLWERIQSVSRNHGLARLWIQDENPFWRSQGFLRADSSALEKLPTSFGGTEELWLSLKLRDEAAPTLTLEHEFELFKESQRELSARVLRQARTLRVLASIIALLALAMVVWGVWHIIQRLPAAKSKSNSPFKNSEHRR